MAVYSGDPKHVPGTYPQIRPDARERPIDSSENGKAKGLVHQKEEEKQNGRQMERAA
jgi:hypothetical protein